VPLERWEFYNGDMILKLAEKLPDIDFHLLAAEGKSVNLSNVYTYGFVEDINSFYKNNSSLLRITTHDGLPKMVIEALSYGRQIIWNYPFPNCINIKTFEECEKVLNNLKVDCSANINGKDYVDNTFNTNKILEEYHLMFKSVIKQI
jgi:hypothetical protein